MASLHGEAGILILISIIIYPFLPGTHRLQGRLKTILSFIVRWSWDLAGVNAVRQESDSDDGI